MAQEFTIKSKDIEDKINQLLPSQGGFQPGVDFSASTMVIPIVDLTETAEGSNLRQDLQSSLSLASSTTYSVTGTTSTLINTTGYFRVFGNNIIRAASSGNTIVNYDVTDGTTTKTLIEFKGFNSSTQFLNFPNDFIVFLQAGDSLRATSDADCTAIGVTRQIADINGNLINP
tara:strand:+ start:148 stop:666 length:519 start_codon:yes stop_codon:yes gene_type:complete